MTRNENGKLSWPCAVVEAARGSLASFYEHWALALFSLVAAFSIWFVIQDVENPRIRDRFPGEAQAGLVVEAINTDDAIPNRDYRVHVEVEGREDDLAALSPDDFEATIDVKDLPVGVPSQVPVKVVSHRDGVRVISVDPATVEVTLEPLVERQLDVTVTSSGQLPTGFTVADRKLEPLTVTVRGLEDLLATVVSVDLDVNLNALREGTTTIENELKARSITGAEVDVTITPARGKVTYVVEQSFVQRLLPVVPVLTGQPATGYRIGAISIEPPVVLVAGEKSVVDGLTQLTTEAIALTNANSEIRLIRNIETPQKTALERRTVSIRIEVKPIECAGGPTATPCGAVSVQVAPAFTGLPPGLFVQGTVAVTVQLTGPLAAIQALKPGDVKATVSLAGGAAGPGLFPVTVTLPASSQVKAEQPDPVPVTLGTNP